jgi:hypothetical protein
MVPETQVKTALAMMSRHAVAGKAAWIGVVTDRNPLLRVLRTVVGTHRLSELLSGRQRPQLC